jgi:hypothetical protein
MRWVNIYIIKRNSFIAGILSLAVLNSCTGPAGRHNALPENQPCDSIVYVLNDHATTIITDSLIGNQSVCYCAVLSNVENNEYTFTFPYNKCTDVVSERQRFLLQKTNHFINLKGRILPVLFMEDELFANVPKDTIHYIRDYNFATIKVNAKSRVIDWHRW